MTLNYQKTETGDYMNNNIIGAVAAAVIGILIALANYLISKNVLEKAPDRYSVITIARQVLQVGYLVAVYFIADKTGFADPAFMLIGAVLGMTLPMFAFTKKLLAVNEAASKKSKGKEDETDG